MNIKEEVPWCLKKKWPGQQDLCPSFIKYWCIPIIFRCFWEFANFLHILSETVQFQQNVPPFKFKFSFLKVQMCLWIFYCAFFPKQWNNLFNLCSVCKLCHNLNSLVVLYLEFCAWFNMKGELGESLPKQKRYFNWYISIHYARKNVFENIFKLNLRLTKGGCSQTFLPFLFSLYWTILSWRWRAGRVKSHHKFWQKHTFYICIVSRWSVSSNHTEAPDRLSHFLKIKRKKIENFREETKILNKLVF